VPGDFAAVLSGHIHRRQTRRHDLAGRRLAAPVIYPGSTARIAFAEREETKGTVLLEVAPGAGGAGILVRETDRELPARPMVIVDLDDPPAGRGGDAASLTERLRRRLAMLDPESIVRVRAGARGLPPSLTAAALRELAPPTMTIDLDRPRPRSAGAASRRPGVYNDGRGPRHRRSGALSPP
jgi:hypothetical protein